MRKFSPILIAVLGIIVGALAVTTYNAYRQKKHYLNVQYGQWRKLNLILDQIDKNYVDTVDNKSVTEAAIVAALSKLDPHSVYMPPVEFNEADKKISLSMKALEAGAPDEEREEASFPKDYKLPKAEELGTSLGSLLKNIKL